MDEENGLNGLLSSTDSISKGVFAFKRGTKRNSSNGTKTKSKKKRLKKSNSVEEQLEEHLSDDIFGSNASGRFRQSLFQSTWTLLNDKLKAIQKETFDKVLSDVLGFCLKERDTDFIPTCSLVTGVNMPDHKDLFKLLSKSLRKSVSEHVACVRSSECSTLKTLVKRITYQFYHACDGAESDNDEDSDDQDEEASKKNSPKFLPTLAHLSLWYENQHPRKSKRPPLVLILEDFEGFSSQVLRDLVSNINECKDALPFCLIFGIATTVDSIHRLLPHGTTSKLAIDSFTSTPSIHLLAKFIESIVMDSSIYFQLGGKVLKILLETFSFHDLSVRHFLMALKFCVLNHFASNEMSVFCCQLPKRTEAFGLVGKKMIREYNDLEGTLKSMDRKTSRFNLVVAALHSIVHNLPKQPLGKNFHHVYNLAMTEPVTKSHDYMKAFQYLEMSERVGLINLLHNFAGNFKSTNDKSLLKIYEMANGFIDSLANIGSSISTTTTTGTAPINNAKTKTLAEIKSESPRGKLDRFKLQQALLEQAKEKKEKNMNPFEVLRKEIIAFLHSTFTDYLNEMPSQWALNDVFYYDDVATVKKMLLGAPRASIQSALSLPCQYIHDPDLANVSAEQIPAYLPDICIAYKLHLESGKLINLYDWLQCWISIVGSSEGSDMEVDTVEEQSGPKVVDKRLHARFSRAVSELQFLGFIRNSKRKTDHVERLTF